MFFDHQFPGRVRSRRAVAFGAVLIAGAILPSVSALAVQVAPESSRTRAAVADAPGLAAHSVTGFEAIKTLAPPAALCAYTGGFFSTYFQKVTDCLRLDFQLSGTESGSYTVKVRLLGPDGTQFAELNATRLSAEPTGWSAVTPVETTWPSGRITARVVVTAPVADAGTAGDHVFFANELGADVAVVPKGNGSRYQPGEAILMTGNIHELDDLAAETEKTGVPATFKLRVKDPESNTLHTTATLTADSNGDFPAVSIPGSATAGLTAGPETDFQISVSVDVIDGAYTDAITGAWASTLAGTAAVPLVVPPTTLLIESSYVSSVGWVKPGDTYPFRVFVRNFTDASRANVVVTIPDPDGTRYMQLTPLTGSGTATVLANGNISWNIGTLAAAPASGPSTATLVVEAKADTLVQDPEIVWKDLSSTATVTYNGGPGGLSADTHGPKVIPPGGDFETSRYGDKPFPVIPVDYTDRKHAGDHDGEEIVRVINSPDFSGSTFNLYQEMSYGQLYPIGAVPSAATATAGFDYAPGFEFSKRDLSKPTCRGATFGETETEFLWGTPTYPERISNGWYQLPGDTEYYGGDFPVFTLGTGSTIDGACGNTSKSVYDAAVIADPEIDYSDFDSDKDGVVDFLMMVFVGLGGNGDSQINGTPPYDNIWPHSSSLEFSYQDEATGLQGYISDDQLKDLTGKLQCWIDNTYTNFDVCAAEPGPGAGQDGKPVYVRVGPYNVNPESAIEKTSVIGHEYGHHLGLPDYYSTSYEAYADWNLMAGDYSQHMTIFSKQELGWVVPQFLQPTDPALNVSDWEEIKNDTGAIRWQRPNGTFYTLSAANGDQNIHNGEAYAVKLPKRVIIDPNKVATQASAPNLWHSGRGNDFGCTPMKGHNLDIVLPELESLPANTPVTLTFKSSWDIEWDWDYGFTMVTTNGEDYTSLPSANGYTTQNVYNPNNAGCLDTHDNGLTGLSGSYEAGTETIDRNPAAPNYDTGSPFLEDEYDLTAYAGERGVVLRFSYFTDPAFDRPGWFIDDLKVAAGGQTIYESDFTQEDELRIVPGGCSETGQRTAALCTAGWDRIDSSAGSPLDHGYFLELRDRSGFDFNGRGQSDRGDIAWAPGALIEYTDEVRGYGNVGGGMPPRQHYIDSQPTPGSDCGDGLTTPEVCEDAAFTSAIGDGHFDDDPSDPEGDWVDNFSDDTSEDGLWHFGYDCLSFDITSMNGHTANSVGLPSDLTANAVIDPGPGCATFSYTGQYPNVAPLASADARPNPADVNQLITFDGSGSSDDRQPSEDLTYQWDFTNNGSFDDSGQVVTRSYGAAGQYTARLRVTDGAGLTDETLLQVVVVGTTAPDLKIGKVTFQNLSTANGKRVRVTAVVRNIGDGAAPASRTHFRHDTQFIGLVPTPGIAAGGRAVVSARWDARGLSGRHSVVISADHTKLIGESREDNNRRVKWVTLRRGWAVQ